MDSIKLKARAKVNLGLDVIRRREDGYHEVRMIMQSIGIYDVVTMRKINDNSIILKTNVSYLPTNENNPIYKAIKLLFDEFDIKQGVVVELEKYIPVAAGMAGGSSDAAAALMGINKLFDLGLSDEELMLRGVKIGADVPFCIMRGTVLAEGIGEILTRLPNFDCNHILVAKPAINVSTKFVYENLKLGEATKHPDIDGMIEDISNKDIYGMCSKMGNVLEDVTINEYKEIEHIKKRMISLGAINAMMSGSGPTVFGIFPDFKVAGKAYNKLCEEKIAKNVYLTKTFQV
ncbi:MAG: 4-(cytidine 5'-diphospho)-2-C-methyl-D-erythritol kinase [Lachnospiraceae bacterium]|nr:4-(cytidine 5'-diphospho)-2-C-methyl-D-erythritol kinase [Lachnospiraceae bacterium]